jgi:hypothetical protein
MGAETRPLRSQWVPTSETERSRPENLLGGGSRDEIAREPRDLVNLPEDLGGRFGEIEWALNDLN